MGFRRLKLFRMGLTKDTETRHLPCSRSYIGETAAATAARVHEDYNTGMRLGRLHPRVSGPFHRPRRHIIITMKKTKKTQFGYLMCTYISYMCTIKPCMRK